LTPDAAVLPLARHEPVLAHAEHDDAPDALKVPTAHATPVVVMVVEATLSGTLTVSEHVAPAAHEPAVTVTTTLMPVPASVEPTLTVPDAAVSESVVPAMDPVPLADPVPETQKEPAGQSSGLGTAPSAQYLLTAHWLDVAVAEPASVQ
jgi:hypothetical protein